jgi:hypothetical protein
VTWGFDDWTGWIRSDRARFPDEQEPFEIVNEILAAVRGHRTKTVACLGRPSPARLRFLAGQFARVVAFRDATDTDEPSGSQADEANVEHRSGSPFDLTSFQGSFDVVLAIAPLTDGNLTDLDRRLTRIHDSLVEGGLMITTFPAAPCGPIAREMRLRGAVDPPNPAFHEIELQYRLRRAGFRGVRVRRLHDVEASGRSSERLLAAAVRRANN